MGWRISSQSFCWIQKLFLFNKEIIWTKQGYILHCSRLSPNDLLVFLFHTSKKSNGLDTSFTAWCHHWRRLMEGCSKEDGNLMKQEQENRAHVEWPPKWACGQFCDWLQNHSMSSLSSFLELHPQDVVVANKPQQWWLHSSEAIHSRWWCPTRSSLVYMDGYLLLLWELPFCWS